ncbi:MAG: carbon storage regulator [Planctomycetales bacterium]|nr:carbon storage regulator [Planctomycetales bacterium]
MLVLTVKPGDRIKVGDGWITWLPSHGNRARLALDFADEVKILREKLVDRSSDGSGDERREGMSVLPESA